MNKNIYLKMPYYCTVPRCTSMAGKAKNVSFHQFPRDEELAKLWNQLLKRGKPYTKYSKVCSLHFKPDDYIMTSSQKNRGQWRTLRKDAIPSQNLPSESHVDDWHKRKRNPFQLPVDTTVQHQMAQTIYVQTMLAMQAAGINETNDHPSPSNSESASQDEASSSSQYPELNKLIPPEPVTYKCVQCSKCFKDPDVFILHQRNHVKTENNAEMLKANPILANLLKTDSKNNKNVISIENQIVSALTENMANYLHKLSTIMTRNSVGDEFGGLNIQYDREMCESINCDYKENNIEKIKPAAIKQHSNSETSYTLDYINRIENEKLCTARNERRSIDDLEDTTEGNIHNTMIVENEQRTDNEETL